MHAGQLRHRVAIQRATETKNGLGEPVHTWATQVTRWMRVEPMQGKELFEARQVNPKMSHKVTMRYDGTTSVTPDDRLLWGSRVFNIVDVQNVEERDIMTVMRCWEDV